MSWTSQWSLGVKTSGLLVSSEKSLLGARNRARESLCRSQCPPVTDLRVLNRIFLIGKGDQNPEKDWRPVSQEGRMGGVVSPFSYRHWALKSDRSFYYPNFYKTRLCLSSLKGKTLRSIVSHKKRLDIWTIHKNMSL